MGLKDKITSLLKGKSAKKPARLQRNDPCWCGSGKKYKRCHCESDQKRPIGKGPRKPT